MPQYGAKNFQKYVMEKVIEPIFIILLQKNFRPFFARRAKQKLGKKSSFFCVFAIKSKNFTQKMIIVLTMTRIS